MKMLVSNQSWALLLDIPGQNVFCVAFAEARLCTTSELRADEARTPSGDQSIDCNGDFERVWSADGFWGSLNCPRYSYISLGGSSQSQGSFFVQRERL